MSRVGPGLARQLADRRKSFNTRVAGARSRNPGFDTAALSDFLAERLDPLVEAALVARPDSAAVLVDAGFDMALALVEYGWNAAAGTSDRRFWAIDRIWHDVGPRMPGIVAANPRETLGSLTNAAIKMAQEPGVRLGDWMATIRSLAARARSPAELRALAVLAAWRAGAAHMRDAALRGAIDPALACAAVGAPDGADWGELTAQYGAHRWWTPDRSAPAEGHRLGAFTGLGGRFSEPPRLGVMDGGFVLASGEQWFALEADAYGATLRPISHGDLAGVVPAVAPRQGSDRQIHADDRQVAVDWLPASLSVARTADSIAVVSAQSYGVRVFPAALP